MSIYFSEADVQENVKNVLEEGEDNPLFWKICKDENDEIITAYATQAQAKFLDRLLRIEADWADFPLIEQVDESFIDKDDNGHPKVDYNIATDYLAFIDPILQKAKAYEKIKKIIPNLEIILKEQLPKDILLEHHLSLADDRESFKLSIILTNDPKNPEKDRTRILSDEIEDLIEDFMNKERKKYISPGMMIYDGMKTKQRTKEKTVDHHKREIFMFDYIFLPSFQLDWVTKSNIPDVDKIVNQILGTEPTRKLDIEDTRDRQYAISWIVAMTNARLSRIIEESKTRIEQISHITESEIELEMLDNVREQHEVMHQAMMFPAKRVQSDSSECEPH